MKVAALDLLDDDGNVMAFADVSVDVKSIIYLMEYSRKRGFKIGPMVQVGEAVVQVSDLRQKEGNDSRLPADLPPDSDMAVVLTGNE